MTSSNMLDVVLFGVFIAFVVLLGLWSVRDCERQLREHDAKMREQLREHVARTRELYRDHGATTREIYRAHEEAQRVEKMDDRERHEYYRDKFAALLLRIADEDPPGFRRGR